MSDKKTHIYGAIFGQAIGDALGHPIEFKKTHKVVDLEEKNLFTDDTQMFCAIGEALLQAPPHIDEDRFMATVAKKFDEWRHSPLGGSHRAPGGNCMDAVRRLGAGVRWPEAGGLDYKGNGSAMRSGIVGAYYWDDPAYAFRIGGLTSVCTHNNLESILGAAMVAFLVAHSIKYGDLGFGNAVAEGLLLCADFERTLPFYPRKVKIGEKFDEQNPWYATATWGAAFALGAGGGNIEDKVAKVIDRENIVVDGAVVPAVAEAILFNANFGHYGAAVLAAVNNSDDTDTIGAITGTIVGARKGISNIPLDWVQRIELADYLGNLAEKIDLAADGWINSQKADAQVAEIVAGTQPGELEFDKLFEGEDLTELDLDAPVEVEFEQADPRAGFCRHNRPNGKCPACTKTERVYSRATAAGAEDSARERDVRADGHAVEDDEEDLGLDTGGTLFGPEEER
jgi:ADP-ribosylglycohydrolase